MKTWMRVLSCLALALCACAGPKPAGRVGPESSMLSLVEAERSFARAVSQKGERDAFLEFLADDGVIFRPHPVNGKEWFSQQHATAGLLNWQPTYAEVARSNDLGYTTGPWELRREAEGEQGVTYGHYVSIWRRNPGGSWRLLLDVGTVHHPPTAAPSKVEFGPGAADYPESVPGVDVESEKEALLETDRVFSEYSESYGHVAAYMSFAAGDIRFYRMDKLPVSGKKSVREMLHATPGLLAWKPMAAGASRAGDLGYTYGVAEFVEPVLLEGKVLSSSYLRIWRKDEEGNWNVALDIAVSLQPSQSEAD